MEALLKDLERAPSRRAINGWLVGAGALSLGLGSPSAAKAFELGQADAAMGLRAALERGALAAVGELGRSDGFLGNANVRIPLPGFLREAAKVMRAVGQGDKVDELITAMNRAAEAAVPEGKALIVSAARAITAKDAVGIIKGGDTSVTDFFNRSTRDPLGKRFLPIVAKATERVSLAKQYDALAKRASKLGLMNDKPTDIKTYITGKALDGLYFMIAEEERKIRRDPIGTGSAILRRVFGG
jgi:hypothetical protein